MNKPNTKSLAIFEIVSNMETECEDLRKENKKLLERISELEEMGFENEALIRIINKLNLPPSDTLMRSKNHPMANNDKLGKLG